MRLLDRLRRRSSRSVSRPSILMMALLERSRSVRLMHCSRQEMEGRSKEIQGGKRQSTLGGSKVEDEGQARRDQSIPGVGSSWYASDSPCLLMATGPMPQPRRTFARER